ncbi:sensor histidine kinase [Rubrivirga sp. IMCC43871]|uniref:sensor histidine kinase n=1 Tax=Rubrivirga sp. IMCC43871 TaxID=3391575 RepID=UPI00398F8EEC
MAPLSAPAPLADRLEAAEAALRNVALSRPNALALLEAGVTRMGEALGAEVAVALVGESQTGAFVRCASWPPVASPALVEVEAADAPPLVGRAPVSIDGGPLAEALGAASVLVIPVESSVPGAFMLGRPAPWTPACEAAAGRLGALFGTLWAWVEAETRFRRTVADLDDALFTFGHDDDGHRAYAFVTAQAEAITGLDPDVVLAGDADWADLVVPEDRAAFDAHDARLRAGEPSQVEVRLRLDGGDVVWISERARPSVDAVGRPVAGGLLADVTAQKEAEAQLDRARRIAERAAQTRMAFLRMMSHELRTPLGAIRGFSDLLVEEAADIPGAPPEVAEFAGTIRDAASRALRLVTDLLDLSRLETGALDLAHQPVDLTTLARAVTARYTDDLAARGVTLTVAAPADALMVEADPSRLEQVVDQLLSNAARFTPAGSVVVSLAASADRVRLEVRDTGVGIADDVLEAVFEPFVQEDARVNRDYGGTGLGLAIASRLVQQMGGDLSAASVKGEGSTFTLALPAA